MIPDKAAAELEQRLRSGAFKGAVINGHVHGRYLDDKFFWPILECAEALNAPIHIHPTKPPQPVFDAYYAGSSPVVSDVFGSPGWGWHIETAVHVLRLILGGALDRFPKLQLVIGHLGEGLMSLFPRLDNMTPAMTKLQRNAVDVLRPVRRRTDHRPIAAIARTRRRRARGGVVLPSSPRGGTPPIRFADRRCALRRYGWRVHPTPLRP
jgi:predicted TIM-barrel fold metal-dependent hydrolase